MYINKKNTEFESEEIYPYIVVYKNLFSDIDKVNKLLIESTNDNKDRVFSEWTQWSIFGEYLNPVVNDFTNADRYGNVENINAITETQKDQKQFLLELFEIFHQTTDEYIKRYNVPVDYSKTSIDLDKNIIPTWRYTGPTICKYYISNEKEKYGMRYHSDYIRETYDDPGYKFVITGLAYFNDDYIGGEIDFAIGKKLLKYKPKAGDYIVFPSGHPEYLTEDGIVYLHGVMPSEGNNKYFSRMYLQEYFPGSESWFENEEKYGKDNWASMQEDLRQKHRDKYPQRSEIEGGIRI